MADGDYYLSYANVQSLVQNANIGVAGSSLFDADGIEKALKITQGMIHFKLKLSTLTKLTDVVLVEVLGGIQGDLVSMFILRARHFKDNNLADAGSIIAFWQYQPTFTRDHKDTLREISDQRNGVAFNYDTRTGEEV